MLLLFCAQSAVLAASPQTTVRSDSISSLCSQADSGDSAERRQLTQLLLQHNSAEPDFAPALDCLRFSATRGNPDAQFLLAYLFEHGHGVPRDISLAAKYDAAAAGHGHPIAQNNLAFLYQHGLGVPRDLHKAFDLYTIAAQHGNSVAQTNLASMYLAGKAIPRNYAAAVQWLRAAADQDNATAQHDLGVLYYLGLGVFRDLTAAAHGEGLAAVHGNTLAQTDLAYFYETGSGVPRDYFAAFLWYSRAIAAGDSSGASRRDSIAHLLNRKQRDEGAAIARSSPSPARDPLTPATAGSLSVLPSH